MATFITTQALAADVMELEGRGVQVYQCKAEGDRFGWTLAGPEATLLAANGAVAGRHFPGPSWQANDGSIVVGEVLASGTLPTSNTQARAIPWLVLQARSHTGTGAFSAVTYITRTRTAGGLAPSTGCDAAYIGREERVAYTATYTFFGVK